MRRGVARGHGQALPSGVAQRIYEGAAPTVIHLSDANEQRAVSSAGAITADITSPVGREIPLQVDVDPGASYVPTDGLVNPYPHYFWTVFDRDTGVKVVDSWSGSNRKRVVYPRAGHFRVKCVFVDPRKGQTAPLTIEQDVVAEDPSLASNLSNNSDYADAERELVDDFRPYVESGAAATGPLGITARFLAAILRLHERLTR